MSYKKFIPRVQQVDALQITADNAAIVSQFLDGAATKFVTADGRETDATGEGHRVAVLVPTTGGQTLAVEGDFLTRDAAGTFAVISGEVFARDYDEAEGTCTA